MSENTEDREFDDASIVCWERAVYHAETAQRLAEDAMQIWELSIRAVREQQALAGAYLGMGGYGEDPRAYEELGLPYGESDAMGEQEGH
jgi:hypothetical protein